MKIRKISSKLADRTPLFLYRPLVNLRNALTGRAHRLMPLEPDGLFRASDGTDTIQFCRRRRHSRYKRGIEACANRLAGDYHLNKLMDTQALQGSGLLIDCGANVGELGWWARRHGMAYVAFEPEPLEARCCDLNNFSGEQLTWEKALWKEDATLEFFSKPDSADSSIFDMGSGHGIVRIEAVALDGAIDLSAIDGTIILKVEAEGAEPEVLEGAQLSLKYIDYVTVDCGPERGREKAPTFIDVNRILSARGFDLIEMGFKRVTALYRNTTKEVTRT